MPARIADVRSTVAGLVGGELRQAAGSNDVVSKAEQAAMAPGVAKDAVAAARAAGGSGARVTTVDAFAHAEQRLWSIIDGTNDASGGSNTYLAKTEILAIALVDRPVAELCAVAYQVATGKPMTLPAASGDPDGSPAVPVDPPVLPPVVAAGNLEAQVDAALPAVKTLLRTADFGRDGTLSFGEAKSFAKRMNNGFFPDDVENLGTAGRVIWEARQDAWRATGSAKPTLAQIDDALDVIAARARTFSTDANNFIRDPAGDVVDGTVEGGAYWLAAIGIEGVDLAAEPYVRMFDHEGDVAAAKRLPLDLNGTAKDVVRRIVFHVNEAGNDNHWPLWSGRATSRYQLGAGEAQQVKDVVAAQTPARAKALLNALADWIADGAKEGHAPGCAYLDAEGLPIIEQLAADLGVQRSFVGVKTAPVLRT